MRRVSSRAMMFVSVLILQFVLVCSGCRSPKHEEVSALSKQTAIARNAQIMTLNQVKDVVGESFGVVNDISKCAG